MVKAIYSYVANYHKKIKYPGRKISIPCFNKQERELLTFPLPFSDGLNMLNGISDCERNIGLAILMETEKRWKEENNRETGMGEEREKERERERKTEADRKGGTLYLTTQKCDS
jgi:hypothetical protein